MFKAHQLMSVKFKAANIVSDVPLEQLLDLVQQHTFRYFWDGAHPITGLPYDRRLTYGDPKSDLISIGASGFAFMAIVIGVTRNWITRQQASDRIGRVLIALNQVSRYHGAFPHFINGECQTVSFGRYDDGGDLVETSLLLQGLICAREYFDLDTPEEIELRNRSQAIIESVEWNWYVREGEKTLYWHWSPKFGWKKNLAITGWNEALITYILAIGAKRHAIDANLYHSGWTKNGAFRNGNCFYGVKLPLGAAYGGPLFLSELPFCALDPNRLDDGYADYWEQATAHAMIHYRHSVRDQGRRNSEGPNCWGLSACHGPKAYINCSPSNDQGIIAPSAALSSFPFVPEQSETALRYFLKYRNGMLFRRYGFVDAFSSANNWIAKTHLAINQGLTLAMIENYRTGLMWKLFSKASECKTALNLLKLKKLK